MATTPPIGPDAPKVTSDAFEVFASIDVDAIVTRLSNEAKRLQTDYSQRGLTDREIADAVEQGLRDLSDTPLDQAGRMASSEAFNLGRNLGIQEAGIKRVVRTEVLDIDTCPPCRALDVSISKKVYVVNSPEYFEDMPPNHCSGRELCRGFYLARSS